MGDLYWSSLANSPMDYDWCNLLKCNHFQCGVTVLWHKCYTLEVKLRTINTVYNTNTAQLWEPGSCSYWSFQSSFKCKFLNNFSLRIFLSYQSRQALLETELGSTLELTGTCGCPPSDGSYPGASDPSCPYIRRREIVQFLV